MIGIVFKWDFGRRKFINLGANGKQPGRVQTLKDNLSSMRSHNKQWVHTPEALLQGHIVYNVKFLGECEVEQPKGIDIVKDAIRKMKFNKHIKKAEGQKPPKVELTISADGVTIQDPKTKIILHQNPLHRISYCADDKSDKRMFTFIAKAADSNKHFCYVFDSEKCAEEITLTVGQAFDLAYRRFVETTGRDIDVRKQFLLLQKKVNTLQQENEILKKRIVSLEKMKDKSDVEAYKNSNNICDLTTVTSVATAATAVAAADAAIPSSTLGSTTLSSSYSAASTTAITELLSIPLLPSPGQETAATVANKKTSNHSLSFNGTFANGSTTPHNLTAPKPLLQPPPSKSRPNPISKSTPQTPVSPAGVNLFSANSGEGSINDPFGMGDFNPLTTLSTKSNQDLDLAINKADKEFMDLQAGFSRGLSFGPEDFSLDDLDPLNQKS